jgi:hypothetical protein
MTSTKRPALAPGATNLIAFALLNASNVGGAQKDKS